MSTIEQDVLLDLIQIFRKVVRSKLVKRLQRRLPRPQERRSLIEEVRDLMQHDAEASAVVDRLTPEERQQVYEEEARKIQGARDRLDNDPALNPEDIDLDDLDRDGQNDAVERRDREQDERNRTDRDGDGIPDAEALRDETQDEQKDRDDAVEDREEDRERDREEDHREAEENRGGDGADVVPAAAAVGTAAVVADELDEDQLRDAQDAQDADGLNEPGQDGPGLDENNPEVTELTDDGQVATQPVIGEDNDRDNLSAEQDGPGQDGPGLDENDPEVTELTDDGQVATQPVIGEDNERDDLSAEQESDPYVTDLSAEQDGLEENSPEVTERTDDGQVVAQPVIGEDDNQREDQQAQQEPGDTGPQPALPTAGDERAAAEEAAQNEQNGQNQQNELNGQERQNEQDASVSVPDPVETRLAEDRSQHQAAQANGQSQNGQAQNGRNGMSQSEVAQLKSLQDGHAAASGATQQTGQAAVATGHAGRTAGSQRRELGNNHGRDTDNGRAPTDT